MENIPFFWLKSSVFLKFKTQEVLIPVFRPSPSQLYYWQIASHSSVLLIKDKPFYGSIYRENQQRLCNALPSLSDNFRVVREIYVCRYPTPMCWKSYKTSCFFQNLHMEEVRSLNSTHIPKFIPSAHLFYGCLQSALEQKTMCPGFIPLKFESFSDIATKESASYLFTVWVFLM
jgi:hypothetical protein